MRGAELGLVGHGCIGHLHATWGAGLAGLHAHTVWLLADEFAALGQVGGVEQAHPVAGGRLHEVGVTQVLGAVGKGQAGRLGIKVQPLRAGHGAGGAGFQRQLGGIGVVQHAQDLADGDGARAGGRKAAESVVTLLGAVVGAQGGALHRLVAGQVGHAEFAGVAGVALHLLHDGLGDVALVESLAALGGNTFEHGGQLGVAQGGAHGHGIAVGLVEIGGSGGVFLQVLLGLGQGVEAGADLEAVFGQVDGRLEQGRPWQLAVLLVGHFQHAQRAGGAYRAATHHGVVELHGFAVCADKELFVSGGGRGLAAVEGLHVLAVVVHQESAAANAAGLRLHQRQHHLHGNRRVDGRATRLEHLVTRVGSQRVGGSHGKFAGGPAGLGGVAGRALGLHRRRRVAELLGSGLACTARQQQGGGECAQGGGGFHLCLLRGVRAA